MRTAQIPAPGATVLGRDFQVMDGGKGSNQAVACARLGAQVAFVAAVGDDPYGNRALALYAAEGVNSSHVRRAPNVATGAGFIIVDDNGNNAIVVDLGANNALSPEDVDRAEDLIARADVVLSQLEIPPETAVYALAVARRHGVRTILNPAPAQLLPVGSLEHIDMLTPNLWEAQVMSGLASSDAVVLSSALRQSGVPTVVLTLGARGAHISGAGGTRAVPAIRVDPVDTTGAGDAFSAALAVSLAEGAALEDAVGFACAAGAYSTTALGTIPSYPTRSQLAAFIASAGAYQ